MERLRELVARFDTAPRMSEERDAASYTMGESGATLLAFIASPESVDAAAGAIGLAANQWRFAEPPLGVAMHVHAASAVLSLLAQKALDDGS
jgi:hypothetical protein